MLKISTKASVNLSIVFSILFFVVIIAGAFILPSFINGAMNFPTEPMEDATRLDRYILLGLGYFVLAVVAVIDSMLLALLFRVRAELVFTSESISLIRVISWGAVILGLAFFALGWYFIISFFVAFACIFLGICIRIVKNVIEKATEIKAENDYTI